MTDTRIYKYDKNKKSQIEKDLIKTNKAFNMCREVIDEDYIEDAFNRKDIEGFIAKRNGKYVGFIMFYKVKDKKEGDYLYLDVICSKGGKKGLGQQLIKKMEKYAKDNKINILRADAVEGAMSFYRKNGWNLSGELKRKKGHTQTIEKRFIKKKKNGVSWKDLDKRELEILKEMEEKDTKKQKKKRKKKKKPKKEEGLFMQAVNFMLF